VAYQEQDMHVLQGGFPKSGNYWLANILNQILDCAGVPRQSYVQRHPIFPIAQTWPLSYPEQAGLDVLDIEPHRNYWRISSYYREPIDDIAAYVAQNRHVWTHSRYLPGSAAIFALFDKIVYIVRDPRDAAISMAHFAFTPYRLRTDYNPFPTPDAYLRRHLARHMAGWCNNVGSYLLAPRHENLRIVFYERLRTDFDAELKALIEFLELDVTAEQRAAIGNDVSVSSMQKKSSQHVRKGGSGGWRETLSPSQIRLANLIGGPIMKELGYPLAVSDARLPALPPTLNERQIRKAMRRAVIARGLGLVADNLHPPRAPETGLIPQEASGRR
jgi:aryl sulfotransferase